MRARTCWLLAVLSCAAIMPATAHAFSVSALSDFHVGKSKGELHAQMKYSRGVISFFKQGQGQWMLHRGFRWCSQIDGLGRRHYCTVARSALRNHEYLLGVAKGTWAKLYVPHTRTLAAAAAGGLPGWWLRAALCVHGGEGSWTANTGNGFEGGMQFVNSTWIANGGGRFASHAYLATPHEQLLVAYWTWQRSGWGPWPTTARACGLL